MSENSTSEMIALRKSLGLTQAQMAEKIGLTTRAYHDLESGRSTVRAIHIQAAERAALDIAVERMDPMLAPASVRRSALELARMIMG
jgi:transcriptional regulator with XRE-family HTH domain